MPTLDIAEPVLALLEPRYSRGVFVAALDHEHSVRLALRVTIASDEGLDRRPLIDE